MSKILRIKWKTLTCTNITYQMTKLLKYCDTAVNSRKFLFQTNQSLQIATMAKIDRRVNHMQDFHDILVVIDVARELLRGQAHVLKELFHIICLTRSILTFTSLKHWAAAY